MQPGQTGGRIVVGVCKEQTCDEALTWALANAIKDPKDTLVLLHVVTKAPNPKTEMFQSEVSDANFVHFARTVVQPFMMALKSKVDPRIRLELKVGRNNSKSKGVVEEAKRLKATALILGSAARGMFSVRKFGSLATYCMRHLPPTIELFIVQKSQLVYSSAKGEAVPSSSGSISSFISRSSSATSPYPSQGGEGSLRDGHSFDALASISSAGNSYGDDQGSLRGGSTPGKATPPSAPGSERLSGEQARSGGSVLGGKVGPRKSAEEASPFNLGPMAVAGKRMPTYYRLYSFKEIQAATDNFNSSKLLGEGGFGTVYQATLQHIPTAVKVLKTAGSQRALQEFQQEVEMLGQIQHPHVVMLLGCCPERQCLVYELMAQGSLEDRLRCHKNSPPLPWFVRVRVAAEIASALLCLHTRPSPIVHRDLKPGNVLLDRNLVSKLADVGLASLVQGGEEGREAVAKEAGAVGTLAYVDPEYKQTGEFGPKSDVYALGIVLLDLLTGLQQQTYMLVERASMNHDQEALMGLVDAKAGSWPPHVATELVQLAMWCSEGTRRQRPDLESEVMPVLDRLRAQAVEAEEEARRAPANGTAADVPKALLCPITQEIMVNPVLASDGHTYELIAIQRWMEKSDRSPMTNMKLPSRDLSPNLDVRGRIQEWQQKRSSGVGVN